MHVAERTYASTQPLKDTGAEPLNHEARARLARQESTVPTPVVPRPTSALGMFLRLTRADAAVALAMPALCGAMLGWWETGHFDAATLFMLVLGMLTINVGLNLIGEYADFAQRLSNEELFECLPYFGAYGMVVHRKIQPRAVRQLGRSFLFFGLLAALLLTILAGWPMLLFVALLLLLGYTYHVAPVKYGWRGFGLGEIGFFLGWGLLQAVAGYYAQTQSLSPLALWAGIPLGLLVMGVLFNYNLIYQRRDWLNRKRTLVAQLGLERSVDVSTLLILTAYVAILLTVSLARLPLWTLTSLGALPVALNGFGRLRGEVVTMDDFISLYLSTLSATILTGILFSLALWADKL